jgi:hypothetical protein
MSNRYFIDEKGTEKIRIKNGCFRVDFRLPSREVSQLRQELNSLKSCLAGEIYFQRDLDKREASKNHYYLRKKFGKNGKIKNSPL